MSAYALYGLDLVAALILTFGVYWPRHRRRDLVVAFLGINMGILAVAARSPVRRFLRRSRPGAVRRAVDHPVALR